jgi:hypothetical protein
MGVKGIEADRDLYLDATQTKVVEEGDTEAAFLLARKGKIIPEELADRLGLNGTKVEAATPDGELPDGPLDSMTRGELYSLAKDQKIRGRSKMDREELLTALKEAAS